MSRVVVVSVSIGTGLLLVCLVVLLCLSIGAAVYFPQDPSHTASDAFKLKTGVANEAERSINDLKYGPVNLDAAKEVKNGLFDRLFQRRCSNTPVPVSSSDCEVPTAYTEIGSVVDSIPIIISHQTDAVYIEPPSTPLSTTTPNVSRETPFEYPPIATPGSESTNCPSCRPVPELNKLFRKKESTRSESKTGAFICSHCKNPRVGEEWHTDWAEDGTPITFLCKSCYGRLNPSQRVAAYQAYVSRQMLHNGPQALFHQEVSE
jgi:hypothetical protein